MKVAIDDVMLQIWTINLSDREGIILFLHLCSCFNVRCNYSNGGVSRCSCPRSSSPSKCGSNETSIYKPESSGDASKSRFSVCLFGEGGPSMFEGTTLIASLGIFMGPHWFIYTRMLAIMLIHQLPSTVGGLWPISSHLISYLLSTYPMDSEEDERSCNDLDTQ